MVVFKHFAMQELLQSPRPQCIDGYKWDKLLFILAQGIKLRSTYMMSLLSLASK